MNMETTESKTFLGKNVDVVVDRPLGSLHPKYGFKYELNYGYIPGTVSGDGEELDAYVLGVDVALNEFSGECIAIICRDEEEDDKLIVVPTGVQISDSQIKDGISFQEKWFTSTIVRKC